MMESVTVAILAGGQGRRLGGMDKGLLKVRGRRMAERLLHNLPENLPRLIVANRNLATYRMLGVPVLCDPWPDFRGPLAGMLAALRAATTPWVQFLPCDALALPDDLLSRLMAAARRQQLPAVYAESQGRGHYVCCLIERSLEADLSAALERGERAPHRWLTSVAAQPVDFSHAQPEPLWSMNTPVEMADAYACMGGRQC